MVILYNVNDYDISLRDVCCHGIDIYDVHTMRIHIHNTFESKFIRQVYITMVIKLLNEDSM